MSVQPYTSPLDPNPFTPNAASSGGGGAAIPKGAEVPELAMVFTTAPDFSPVASAGSGTAGGQASPPTDDFSIDLGSLRDAENAMLTASSTIVNAYESLKQLFVSGMDSVFGQQATDVMELGGDNEYGNASDSTTTTPDPIQGPAQTFANGQNGGPGMNDVEAYALQQVADAVALVGQFMAMMNAAGYSYAQADVSSVLPTAQTGAS